MYLELAFAKAVGLTVVVILAAFFMLAPIVYSPAVVNCGGGCQITGGHSAYYAPAYESVSCALIGIGAGYSSNSAVYPTNEPRYQLICPPSEIYPS